MIASYCNQSNSAQAYQYMQQGRIAEAARFCQHELSITPQSAELSLWLASALHMQGHLAVALDSFNASLAIRRTPLVISAIATVLSEMRRYEESLEHAQMALDLAPAEPQLLANLGVALEKLGRLPEALRYYDEALCLDEAQPAAMINRGTVLTKLSRAEEGLQHNRRAVEVLSNLPDVYFNCADALIGLFRYQEAFEVCGRGLALQPSHAALMFKKGLCLAALGQFEQARGELAQAQILNPDIVAVFLPRFLGQPLLENFELEPRLLYLDARYEEQKRNYWENRPAYLHALQIWIDESDMNLPELGQREFGFQLLSLDIGPKHRLKLMQQISEQVANSVWVKGAIPFAYKSQPGARLRIAYISPDFRLHPVGVLTRLIYGLHDRKKFEVVCYELPAPVSPADAAVAAEIRSNCDLFRELQDTDSAAIAQQIFDDGVDILIDLAGYTTHCMTDVLARRPAALQMAYLGYPGTMGA